MSTPEHARISTLAANRAIHRAFSWLHLHEPTIRRWQLETIAIPAPTFHETARAQYFLRQFSTLNLTNPHIDAAGNALAELTTNNQRLTTAPIVLLSAHLDTVFPITTNCTPHEEPDSPKIRAPGACDNAAGLAALLAIAAALNHAEIEPACTILFAANVGEEGEGDLQGMKHLFQSSSYAKQIKAAIAFEGSGNETVIDRALGSRRLRVTVTGPGGHSWADAGLPNPILAISAALIAISRLPLPRNTRSTLNVGTISGGTSVNSIPASAAADLDLRSTSPLQLDRTELAVLNTLQAAITAPTLHLHVQRIGDRAAGALPETSPLSRSLRAVDRHLNLATESRIGSTDANLPLSLNIPALAIGAGGTGGGMHTLNEWYDPTGRDIALRRTLLLLLDACTLAASGLLHSPS